MKPLVGLLMLALATAASAQETPKPVKLMTVENQGGGFTRQFFGQVAAKQTVDLAFQVGGQVVQFPVVEGQTILEGSLVAQLDLEPFELQRDQASVQKDQADRTVERLSKLSGSTVSQVTVDDAETQSALAALALRNAQYSLDHATLSAPFTALVAARNVANYTTIAAGTPVVRLHDMSEIHIEIDVPEVLFQRAGNDPDVTLRARFAASDELFPVGVREFNAETSAVGQTFQITLGLAPPEGLVILPGSSATIYATLNSGLVALPLPPSAIATDPSGATSVLVFEPAGADTGKLRRVPITLEVSPTGQFHVSDGLEPGMEIVAAGVNALEDGKSVRRFVGFGN